MFVFDRTTTISVSLAGMHLHLTSLDDSILSDFRFVISPRDRNPMWAFDDCVLFAHCAWGYRALVPILFVLIDLGIVRVRVLC